MRLFNYDHLNSSKILANSAAPPSGGGWVGAGSFVEEKTGSYSTTYRFTSKELDDETGLVYFGARYYDPKISMWYGVHPLSSSFPSMSGYAYCYNSPGNFVDRWGLFGSRKEARTYKKEHKIRGKITFDRDLNRYVIHDKNNATSYYRANSDFERGLLGYNTSNDIVTSSAPNTNANFKTYSTGFKYLWNNKFVFQNIPDNLSLDFTLGSTFLR